jgi:hypothetical protein
MQAEQTSHVGCTSKLDATRCVLPEAMNLCTQLMLLMRTNNARRMNTSIVAM